jgi:hypothetical protein
MRDEGSDKRLKRFIHPASLRPDPFVNAAASDLDREDQRRSFAGAD